MKRIAALLAVLASAGCGDDPTSPDVLAAASFDIVAGANQSDTIEARLAPIIVELRSGVTAMSGVVVNFRILEDGCGEVFAGSASTDLQGRAIELWDLGTVAKACTMEARAVDSDGTPRVFATTTATVMAGRPSNGALLPGEGGMGLLDSIRVGDGEYVADRWGNEIPWGLAVLSGPAVVRGGWFVPTDTIGGGQVRVTTEAWGDVATKEYRVCWSQIHAPRTTIGITISDDGSNNYCS